MPEKPTASNFVRRLVLRNPNIDLPAVLREWDKAKMPPGKKPDMMAIHQARYAIKNKFDIDDLKDLPFKSPGVLDVVALLKLMIRKKKDLTEQQARHFLASDGVDVTENDWRQAKGMALVPVPQPTGTLVPVKPQPAADDSPDENQHKGPRARHVGKKGRPPGSTTAKKDALTVPKAKLGEVYLQMEEKLDDLVFGAKAVEDSELVTALRDARRKVIIKGHELTKK